MKYFVLYKNDLKNLNINDEVINKVNDFKIEKEESKIAYSYLLYLLQIRYNINIKELEVCYSEKGKPYFKNNIIFFNISHSKDYIALVIDDKECGIDIEYNDQNRNFDLLVKKVLNEKENIQYKNSDNKVDYFYRMWTKKEAYFKKTGEGINFSNLNNDANLNEVKTLILENEKDIYYISIA